MNQQQKLKMGMIIFVATSFLILFIMANFNSAEEVERNSLLEYNRARITDIISDHTTHPHLENPDAYGGLRELRQGTVIFEVEILSGTFAGLTLEANYHMHSPMHVDFEIGDSVSVRIFEFEGEIMITEIRYPQRAGLLFAMVGLFIFFLCLIGGKRGMLAVGGLAFTILSVVFLLIPLITAGYPVVLMTVIVLILVTLVTITLLAGLTAKGAAAILGSLSGVALSALFASIAGNLVHISGYNMGNYRAIIHLSAGARIEGLFISSVLVAAIGAIMDSSMSVASAMEEVKVANPHISTFDLFKSGFNVSRDVMGTMSSTLILAFIGGSLAMMIFMYTSNVTFNQLINNDMIAMEIVMGIAGSFGIILAAPLTAFISAKLLTKRRPTRKQAQN